MSIPRAPPQPCVPSNQQAASDDDNSHQGQGQGHKGPPPVAYACLGTALFKLDETGESAQEVLGEAAKEHPDSLEVCSDGKG